MHKIIRPRGGGKTTTIMDMAAMDPNIVIVCYNVQLYKQIAYTRGFDPNKLNFISYDEFLQRRGYSKDLKYIIDEIDGFIAHCAKGQNIIAYSLSIND